MYKRFNANEWTMRVLCGRSSEVLFGIVPIYGGPGDQQGGDVEHKEELAEKLGSDIVHNSSVSLNKHQKGKWESFTGSP